MASMSSYNAPIREARDEAKIGWAIEAVQEADAWLKTQRAARDFDSAINLIAGDDMAQDEDEPSSDVRVNLTKRIAREMVATVSNMRYISAYRTDNADFDDHVHVINKIDTGWYVNTFADRRLKGAFQYAAGMGTGYLSPVWDPHFHSRTRGDIRLDVYGPRDVLPIQLPSDHDLQRCYAVGLKTEMPINLARATYPKYASDLVPDRDTPSYLAKGLAAVQRWVAPALRVGNTAREKERDASFPTVDLFSFYITDPSINLTDHVVPMGTPGTSWYYEVPYVGMEIPTLQQNTAGQMLYRKATEDDARLYPMRRRLICSKTAVLYDNTSQWWHGKVPIVRMCFDRWVWDALGYSVARDVAPIERSNNRLLRAVDDTMNVRTAPPLAYDENIVSRSTMETLNLRAPREEVSMNLALGDGIKPILDAEYYNIPAGILDHIARMKEEAQWLTGNKDLTAIAKAKQIPGGDTLEKILELAGPLATDIAREVEHAMSELGQLNLPLFFQFYSAKRRVQLVGEDGLTPQDYDYDPGNMIPSHEPGEDVSKPSAVGFVERARKHHENFYYWVNPKSLHQMTQMSRKLLTLQLMKMPSFPLDPWTVAKVLDIEEEFGPPPKGTHTVLQRWVAWKHLLRDLAAEDAEAMQGAGGGPGAGRPNSNKRPAQMATKDGGTRTTLKTS